MISNLNKKKNINLSIDLNGNNHKEIFLILSGLGKPKNTITNNKLIKILENQGYGYAQYDNPGHGERIKDSVYSQEQTWQDFQSIIKILSEKYPNKIIPVINSFPSVSILKNISELDTKIKEKIKYIISIAPILDAKKAFEVYLPLGLTLEKISKYPILQKIFHFFYKIQYQGTNIDIKKFVPELTSGKYNNISLEELDIPTLLLYNPNDKKVNLSLIENCLRNPNISTMEYGKGEQHYLDMYEKYRKTGRNFGEEIIHRATK